MNERIKELILKAGWQNAYTDPKEGFELVFENEEHNLECVKKFAELIKQAIYDDVKEELIPDEVITEEKPEFREYLKGCNGGTVDALCHIKNFGVDIDD
jgi:hypothetical protein